MGGNAEINYQASERLGIISHKEAGQGNVQEIVAKRWQDLLKGTELAVKL